MQCPFLDTASRLPAGRRNFGTKAMVLGRQRVETRRLFSKAVGADGTSEHGERKAPVCGPNNVQAKTYLDQAHSGSIDVVARADSQSQAISMIVVNPTFSAS